MTGCDCHGRASSALHQRAGADNSTWDGGAAMSACAGSDSPASCYGSICAGKKAGDPANQSSWALPHHKHPGDPPNADGVRNALARLPQTEGLVNKADAQAHLEKHMTAIQAGGANALARPAQARADAYQGIRRGPTAVGARLEPFRAWFERQDVLINGKAMTQLDGYASVTGVEYEMYDMWGPYGETINPKAFDQTLAAGPDVVFLLNHRGMTMARTSSGTLSLDADPRGLHAKAFVNPDRQDVKDLLIAIDDKNVTEMSFAFMLTDGQWDEDFEHFEILQVDIDRGDVSAVNFGANPYTSIGARAREILADLGRLPDAAQRAAYDRLAIRFGGVVRMGDADAQRAAAAMAAEERAADPVVAASQGRSVGFYEQMLRL